MLGRFSDEKSLAIMLSDYGIIDPVYIAAMRNNINRILDKNGIREANAKYCVRSGKQIF